MSGQSSMNWNEKFKLSSAKLESLGALIGWESIRRGLKAEDDLMQADATAYHDTLHAGRGDKGDQGGDQGGDMGHIVLGDMVTNYPEKKTSGIVRAAIGAGLLSTGVGAGVGVPMLIDAIQKEQPPPIVVPGQMQIRDWKLGKPTVE